MNTTTSPQLINVSWDDFYAGCLRIAHRVQGTIDCVFGIPTGGCFVALEVAHLLRLPMVTTLNPPRHDRVLVVDDLIDSGETIQPYLGRSVCAVLYVKEDSPLKEEFGEHATVTPAGHWLVFPWEHSSEPDDAVLRLMQHAGIQATKQEAHRVYTRIQYTLEELLRGPA